MNRKVRLGVAVCVSMLLAAFLVVATHADDGATYVGAAKCKMCHNKADEGQVWTKWQESKHAKAFATLKTDEAKAVAEKAGVATAPSEAPECLRCHVTAYEKDKPLPADIKMEDGVQCESCHGPESAHFAAAKKSLADKSIPQVLSGAPKEETCKKCHNPESPTYKEFNFKSFSEKIAHPNPLRKAPKS
ncbi:MAG TPA: cytochrome c family protein [Candidatus Hydrogenedentes bacterium]|nr:cytochrome c family protein [Candidatus Hydrogenedentota bacterium]HOS01905.1 cytochrome c family protein [Candidatus Hydrogenedentota bacterium]